MVKPPKKGNTNFINYRPISFIYLYKKFFKKFILTFSFYLY